MSYAGEFVPNTNADESRGYATRPATAPPAAPYGSVGLETYLSEISGLGKLHKIGLVEEQSTGRTWCLQSDEGASLGGTNLAPAPLSQWMAGLQADVAFRIAALARTRGKRLEHLMVGVTQGLASKGSFARGEAVALIFGLDWDVDIRGNITESEAADLLDSALRTSPAVAAMLNAQDGLFALHTNGKQTALEGLAPWIEPTVVDPRRRYSTIPIATGEATEQVFTFVDGGGQPAAASASIATHSSSDASNTPVGFHVEARGELDLTTGCMRSSTGLPEKTSDRWVILSDPDGQVAPAPLALFAIGSAFCYHTMLSRYVNVRRLPLQNSSLAQVTRYESTDPDSGPAARAYAIQTNMYLNGGATEDETRSLLQVAANTCYVHRAMAMEVPMTRDLTLESSVTS